MKRVNRWIVATAFVVAISGIASAGEEGDNWITDHDVRDYELQPWVSGEGYIDSLENQKGRLLPETMPHIYQKPTQTGYTDEYGIWQLGDAPEE